MRYQTADIMHQSMGVLASGLGVMSNIVSSDKNPLSGTRLGRLQSAVLESGIRLLQHYPKQGWDYDDVVVDGSPVRVSETVVLDRPFCRLMRFRHEELDENAPKVLFVAALSGHHATLSRATFEEFLPDHDVYVTDWLDARHVPLADGPFGFEEYMSYVIEFLEHIGPGVHLVGLCQAGVPSLAAVAVMAREDSQAKPKSMTFMASPMDIRVNASVVTRLTRFLSLPALGAVALHKVPTRFRGAGRLVYPGALQLGFFMTMSMKSHVESHRQFFHDVYQENIDAAEKHRDFYDEYFSVMDATAEFYLETIDKVFIDQQLPKGTMKYRGSRVDCSAITDIPMLTLEGANDNLVVPGQCTAANNICTDLPDRLKEVHVQEDVGHYGIFNGSIFRNQVAPRCKDFFAKHN